MCLVLCALFLVRPWSQVPGPRCHAHQEPPDQGRTKHQDPRTRHYTAPMRYRTSCGAGGVGGAGGLADAVGAGGTGGACGAAGDGGAGGGGGGGGGAAASGANLVNTFMETSIGIQFSSVGVKRQSRTASCAACSKSGFVALTVSIVRTAPFTPITAWSSTRPSVFEPRKAAG